MTCQYEANLKLQQQLSVLLLLDPDLVLQEFAFGLVVFEFFDVVHGGLEDGSLVLPDVTDNVIIPAREVNALLANKSPDSCHTGPAAWARVCRAP